MAGVFGFLSINKMFCHKADLFPILQFIQNAEIDSLKIEAKFVKGRFRAASLAEVGLSFNEHVIHSEGEIFIEAG